MPDHFEFTVTVKVTCEPSEFGDSNDFRAAVAERLAYVAVEDYGRAGPSMPGEDGFRRLDGYEGPFIVRAFPVYELLRDGYDFPRLNPITPEDIG